MRTVTSFKMTIVKRVAICILTGGLLAATLHAGETSDLVVSGTDGDNTIVLRLAAGGPDVLDIVVDESPTLAVPLAELQSVTVNGLAGDDTVKINYTNGFFSVPVFANGGYQATPAGDAVVIEGLTVMADGTSYTPVAVEDDGKSGILTYTVGGVTHQIEFSGMEPVVDLVSASALTVNATAADNAINYTADPGNLGRGLISVDQFETIAFNGKENLIINGGAGSDTINLNNPYTPIGLIGTIAVDGQDPTAGSDTLVFNPIPGTGGSVSHTPSGIGAGRITGSGVTVDYTGIEHLFLVGGPPARA